MGSADVGQEAGTQAEQWLGTRGPPYQAELARSSGRRARVGCMIQACAGAGWLSDPAPPQLWGCLESGSPRGWGCCGAVAGAAGAVGLAWLHPVSAGQRSAHGSYSVLSLDRRKYQGRREGARVTQPVCRA